MPRALEYDPEIADAICERIIECESVLSITQDEAMPASSTIYKWLSRIPEFAEKYARAKAMQMDAMAEEILDIADDGRNDWMTKRFGETEVEMPNPEVLQRSRLRVDTRKWLMSKLAPKKYGDKIDMNLGSQADNPLAITVTRVDREK